MDRTLTAGLRPHRRKSLVATLFAFRAHMLTRRRLARLDDDLLRDIGLDRATAEGEAARPFWDAPEFWRK